MRYEFVFNFLIFAALNKGQYVQKYDLFGINMMIRHTYISVHALLL